MHVLTGDRQGVDLCNLFQIGIPAFQLIAFGIQNHVAVVTVGHDRITLAGHIRRTAAQLPAGIGHGGLVREDKGGILKPLVDDLIYGLVVQISFCQNQGTGGTAHNARQGGGAEDHCQELKENAVFHLFASLHFVALAPDHF